MLCRLLLAPCIAGLSSAAHSDQVIFPQPENPRYSTDASLWSVQVLGIGYLASFDIGSQVYLYLNSNSLGEVQYKYSITITAMLVFLSLDRSAF